MLHSAFKETEKKELTERVSTKVKSFHCHLASRLLVLKRQLVPLTGWLLELRGKTGQDVYLYKCCKKQ